MTQPSQVDSAASAPPSTDAGALGRHVGAHWPGRPSESRPDPDQFRRETLGVWPSGPDESKPWTITCEGDPHSPYRHDYRVTASAYFGVGLDHPDYRKGETCWRCRDCNGAEVALDSELEALDEERGLLS